MPRGVAAFGRPDPFEIDLAGARCAGFPDRSSVQSPSKMSITRPWGNFCAWASMADESVAQLYA